MTGTLTLKRYYPILSPIPEQLECGTGNPIITGYQKPLSTVVFFCQSKFKAVSNRLHSVMAVLLGKARALPFLYRFFQTLSTLSPNELEIISDGLIPNTGLSAMKSNSGETTPQFQKLIFELESIETLSLQSNNFTCQNPRQILADIFQHSQKALNLLHDLKNLRA